MSADPNKDPNQASAPEGAASASGEGSNQPTLAQLQKENEELRKKQADSDRKITELSTENGAITRRLEEVTAPRSQNQNPNPNQNPNDSLGEIGKVIAEALNEAALGNAEQAATKLNSTFSQALTQSQQQAVSAALSQLEMKMNLERHVEKRKTEKPFVKRYEKIIAREAYLILNNAVSSGKRITLEQAFDEAVADFEKTREEDLKTTQSEAPAPRGSQGERGSSGAQPQVRHVEAQPAGETTEDYLAERKKAQARAEAMKK